MKKYFLFFFLVLIFCSSLFAQKADTSRSDDSFHISKNDRAFNLSIGFLNAESFTFGLFEANGSGDPSPALQLNYEHGISDNLSLGVFADYYRVEASAPLNISNIAEQVSAIDINDIGSIFSSIQCILNPSACANETTRVEERVNVFTLGGKLRYHRQLIPQLDTYASTYLGYSFNRRKTITETALDAASDELGLGIEVPRVVYYASVGARYFITDQIGLFGEYGAGNVHLLKLGLSYRLN